MSRLVKFLLLALLTAGMPFLLGSGGCSDGGGLFSIDERQEIELGRQSAQQVEHQYPVIYGTPDAERVERIGRHLAALTKRPDLPWTFKVVKSDDVNAFALPGGPVFVTSGLLALHVPDNELAAVLGHECSHVNQRHSVKQIEKAMAIGMLADLALRNQSDIAKSAVSLALDYGVTKPLSREDEYEADALGVRLSYNAGYPADSMATFLHKLDTLPNMPHTAEWMSDHPNTLARVQRTQRMAEEVGALPRPAPYELSKYDKQIIKHLPAVK